MIRGRNWPVQILSRQPQHTQKKGLDCVGITVEILGMGGRYRLASASQR